MDFYEVNVASHDLFSYLKDNFHIDINSELFIEHGRPLFLNFITAFNTDQGNLQLTINTGNMQEDNITRNGIIIESSFVQRIKAGECPEALSSLLENAHKHLSDFFKKMTKGELNISLPIYLCF